MECLRIFRGMFGLGQVSIPLPAQCRMEQGIRAIIGGGQVGVEAFDDGEIPGYGKPIGRGIEP